MVIPDTLGGRTVDTEEAAEALLEEIDRDARRTLVERCADELAAQGRPWAAVGFSMGAMYACHVAGRGAAGPEEIYLFYSGGDPEGDVRTKRAQLHYVPDDDFFTADEVKETETALRTAGVDLETFEYPGSRHWFAERGTPGFDEAAFELARTRVLDGLRA